MPQQSFYSENKSKNSFPEKSTKSLQMNSSLNGISKNTAEIDAHPLNKYRFGFDQKETREDNGEIYDDAELCSCVEEESVLLHRLIATHVLEAENILSSELQGPRLVGLHSQQSCYSSKKMEANINKLPSDCASVALIPPHGVNRRLLRYATDGIRRASRYGPLQEMDKVQPSGNNGKEEDSDHQKEHDTEEIISKRFPGIDECHQVQDVEIMEKRHKFGELLTWLELDEKKIVPRFKSYYKKNPSFSNMRKEKNRRTTSALRRGILMRKRSCVAVSRCVRSAPTILGWGRKRFIQKSIAESVRRLQMQRTFRSGVYGMSLPDSSLEIPNLNTESQVILEIFHNINDSFETKASKLLKERRQQFKGPSIRGKIKEKAKETARSSALFHRNQILKTKRESSR